MPRPGSPPPAGSCRSCRSSSSWAASRHCGTGSAFRPPACVLPIMCASAPCGCSNRRSCSSAPSASASSGCSWPVCPPRSWASRDSASANRCGSWPSISAAPRSCHCWCARIGGAPRQRSPAWGRASWRSTCCGRSPTSRPSGCSTWLSCGCSHSNSASGWPTVTSSGCRGCCARPSRRVRSARSSASRHPVSIRQTCSPTSTRPPSAWPCWPWRSSCSSRWPAPPSSGSPAARSLAPSSAPSDRTP